jgi:two-component system, chemotaxis family, chemotaxis protein CheV
MASVMDSVDRRTQLAGHNRLELLLFRLGGKQRYGINVFKIKEVISTPRLVRMPNSNPVVKGIAHIRGQTIPVLDLSLAISKRPLEDAQHSTFVIITEFNQTVQGFMVTSVDRIVNKDWKEMLAPPSNAVAHYLTAVTQVENELVEVLDVERVLSEIRRGMGAANVDDVQANVTSSDNVQQYHVLIADDSMVARRQVMQILAKVGVQVTETKNGEEALEMLQMWANDRASPLRDLVMVISDIEMPRMDGYTLATEIRNNPKLKDVYVLLHTSLSGVFNEMMIERVGANRFMPKYRPQDLADAVVERIKAVNKARR